MFYSNGKACSALLIAAYHGFKDIAELLIASGASVHIIDGSGETPLHKASSNGHRNVVELLIGHGSQIDASSGDGCTPLYLAAWGQHREVAQLLLDHGAVVDPDIAVMLGDVKLIKRYLNSGLNANSKLVRGFTKGESWLMTAISGKNRNLVELLLNRGANVNEKMEHTNVSPLHRVSAIGCLDICELLIARGAEVNLTDKDGFTPLLRAFQRSDGNEIIRILIAYGADINVRGCRERLSPLHLAVAQNNKNMVELLLARGVREGLD